MIRMNGETAIERTAMFAREHRKPRQPQNRFTAIGRRAALILVAMCLTVGSFMAGSPAFACDLSTHCYGIAGSSPSGVVGGHATIAPSDTALTVAYGDFDTDEIWLVGSNSSYWVEIGYISNQANIDGLSQEVAEFWFDSRPGGGAHGHVLSSYPTLSARTFYITQSSPTTTYGVGDGTLSAYSTSNSMTPATVEVGSETTSMYACSMSHDYSMGYSTGLGWVNLPSPWTSVDAPQSLTWVSSPTDMNAGVPC
jgi:hypothetical protein